MAEVLQMPPQEATPPSVDMLALIERVVADASQEKLAQIISLYDRLRDETAERAFNAALAAAQEEMRPVAQDQKNEQTRSRYAGLDALAKAVDPILARHGFAQSFSASDAAADGHVRVTMDLMHSAGRVKRYALEIPTDGAGLKGNSNKTPTHAMGSTLSYARRYLKLLALNIATGDDDDGNAASGPCITLDQADQIREALAEGGRDEGKFARYMKVPSVFDIPAARFDDAMRTIRAASVKPAGQPND